ncbi:hypothetical protein LCGC14_1163960 [marine sediment metagenome]|uniref:Uncharacterized protein n=1 Tax=marine sediment metagenome TaxID=412755 RepID=A0A0F9PA25_9ZZZZ
MVIKILKELERFFYVNISYNSHKIDYKTLKELMDELEILDCEYDFISEEDKQKCIENDDIWVIRIYPNNTISFYTIAGSNIQELLNYILLQIHEGKLNVKK